MAFPSPVELFADCAACGLEAGVVEVYDVLVPACRFGIPASTRCKLCEEVFEGHVDRAPAGPLAEVAANACPCCLEQLTPVALDTRACAHCGARASLDRAMSPVSLATFDEFLSALDRLASLEGFGERDAFLKATFVTPDARSLFHAMQRRTPPEVVGDPFLARGYCASARHDVAKPPAPAPRPRTTPDATPPPPSAPPRAIVYPLVSVICADGDVHPNELSVVNAFLHAEGLAPLSEHELRVHPPALVAHFVPRERRQALVQIMCEVAAADGAPDESERRVIQAYASAWNVPDDWLEAWLFGLDAMNASIPRQLWLQLRRFVLSARWGDRA